MTASNTEEIIVYSTSWCPDCHRSKYFFDDNEISYIEIDVEKDAGGLAFVKEVNNGNRVVPTIVFPDGSILVEPPNRALAEKLGITN